jgi:type I restriction enzyme M protein
MLSIDMKKKINTLRDILVGKVPDPKSQVEQITIAMVFKFMDDMDKEFLDDEYFGGERKFFVDTDKVKYSKYAWTNLMNPQVSGQERADLYREGVEAMQHNPNLPDFFKDVFRNAYIPFRDSETINLFLKEINDFTYTSQNSEDLGEAFEMLLSIMGSQGDAGQFRTPRHIIDMIVDIVQPTKIDRVLDPACGTAGFLISAYRFILNHNKDAEGRITLTPDDKARLMQNFEGYDISQDMVRLSRVNMYLHHFSKPKIYEYDTLTSQDRWDDQFDVIFANPPFMTPKGGINPHNRFRVQAKRSEVLFVDYIAEHLAPNGRAGIIVPEGIVFKAETAYRDLRKFLVDDHYLYAVISLPAGVFNPYSGVKTSVLLFDKSVTKNSDQILFITVNNDGYNLGAQRRKSKMDDLPRTVELVNSFKNAINANEAFSLSNEQKEYAILVKKEEVDDNSYFLVGSKYSSKNKKPISSYTEKKLGELCSFMTGGTPKSGCKDFYFPAEVPWLVSGDINGSAIEKCDGYISQSGMENSNAKILPYNSVLIALNGQGKTRGTVSLLKMYRVTCNQSIVSIMPNDTNKLMPEFLFAQLRSMYQEIRSITGDNQRSGLNIPILKEIQIIVPPIEVQQELVAEIDSYQKVIAGAKQVVENYRPSIRFDPSWKRVKLSEILKLSSGRFLPSKDRKDGEYNVYGGNGITGTHNDYFIEKPTLIIGRVGEYCGAAYVTTAKCWITDNALMATDYYMNVDLIYLCTVLNQLNLHQYAKVGGQPSVSQTSLYEVDIPVPNFDIQHRISSELDEEFSIIKQDKRLIDIFEQKCIDAINSLWSSEDPKRKALCFPTEAAELKYAARNCSDKFVEAVMKHEDGDSDE